MTVFITGFPGFLGRALLPRILARTGGDAVCLVQPKFSDVATRAVQELVASEPELDGRIRLLEGDITRPGLDLAGDIDLPDVTEAWHLAAVYDLAVARDLAMRVNVDGTRNVLDFLARWPDLDRLHYFSTCYVSGRFPGRFARATWSAPAPSTTSTRRPNTSPSERYAVAWPAASRPRSIDRRSSSATA